MRNEWANKWFHEDIIPIFYTCDKKTGIITFTYYNNPKVGGKKVQTEAYAMPMVGRIFHTTTEC